MGLLDSFIGTLHFNDEDYDDYDIDDEEFEDEEPISNKNFFGRKKTSSYSREDSYEDEDETASARGAYSSRFNDDNTAAFKPRAKTQSMPTRNNASKLVPLTSAKDNKIFVIQPIEDSECWSVIDFLKEGKAVILNLEGMNVDDAQHIIDIIVGCCYTIEGSIKRVSASIFIAAPNGVEVSGDMWKETLAGEGITVDLRTNF